MIWGEDGADGLPLEGRDCSSVLMAVSTMPKSKSSEIFEGWRRNQLSH